MRKILSLATVLMLILSTFSACGGSSSGTTGTSMGTPASSAAPQAVKTVTLKLAVESAVGTPGEISGGDFKTLVEEKSNGSIKINYYPVGQLGTGDDLTEQMLGGTVDMSWRAIEWYSKLEKGWQILGMGFLFKNEDHLNAFLDSEKHTAFKEDLIKTAGLRMIADKGIGSPRVLVAKKPVNSPEDMKGMNMRVPGLEMSLRTWKGVGVNIMEIPWGEAYIALSQGTVDALESPLGSIYGMKFYEMAKNITCTNHMYSPYVMVINEKSWQQLSPEQQAIVQECAEEAAQRYIKYDKESADANKKLMEQAGVVINETPDIEAFMAKLADVSKQCEAEGMWPAGLYDYVQSLK